MCYEVKSLSEGALGVGASWRPVARVQAKLVAGVDDVTTQRYSVFIALAYCRNNLVTSEIIAIVFRVT